MFCISEGGILAGIITGTFIFLYIHIRGIQRQIDELKGELDELKRNQQTE